MVDIGNFQPAFLQDASSCHIERGRGPLETLPFLRDKAHVDRLGVIELIRGLVIDIENHGIRLEQLLSVVHHDAQGLPGAVRPAEFLQGLAHVLDPVGTSSVDIRGKHLIGQELGHLPFPFADLTTHLVLDPEHTPHLPLVFQGNAKGRVDVVEIGMRPVAISSS